jgi:hypothetical protein
MKSAIHRIGLVIGTTLVLGACGAEPLSQEQSVDNGGATGESAGAEIANTQQAISIGWTAYTSEEYAPIVCDSGSLMNQVQCQGSNCDNIRAYCQPSGGTVAASYWTSYFSEEGTDYRYCNAGYWVTGISCTGDYCDNISLQCTRINGISAINCYWTGWMSEEGGGVLAFGYKYYPRGVQCDGDYCDNKRFYVCQSSP